MSAHDEFLKVFPLVLQLVGLTFVISLDSYLYPRTRRRLLMIIGLISVLLVIDLAQLKNASDLTRTFCSVLGYSVRPAILVLFIEIIHYGKYSRYLWVPVILNTLVYCTSFFCGLAFRVKRGHFHRGPLGYTAFVVGFVLLGIFLFHGLGNFQKRRKMETLIPIFFTVAIILATIGDAVGDGNYTVTLLTSTTVTGCVFCYIWLHLQFVRDHEDALKAEQRIRIMVSQIQPHFLYNTLATIQALCTINPEKASEISEKFAIYLRQNINSLNQEDLIPFSKELEHTKVYTDIEAVRFPNISIVYQIEYEDFKVPGLSVQPLVENAIRHGVRIRDHGEIKVISRHDDENGCNVVIVEDNGKGFVVEEVLQADETHIGLRNVKERIEKMCHGTFLIDSKPNQGTVITMRIPDSENS